MSNELSIGELVRRTGVAEPTLRMWERRHGFPTPMRTPSGHRRYNEAHVEQIQRVVAARAAGLSLKAAIERVQNGPTPESLSLFATLRRQPQDLHPRLIGKPAMIALSHAIEDESLARAERQVLFASFQRERFYRQAQARWRELSKGSVAAVFADFEAPARPVDGPAEVPIASLPALSREWAVVCYGERSTICLAGREPASSNPDAPQAGRVFEVIWTVDPAAVRAAVWACVHATSTQVREVAERAADMLALEPIASAEEQLRLGTAVINRMLSYLR